MYASPTCNKYKIGDIEVDNKTYEVFLIDS